MPDLTRLAVPAQMLLATLCAFLLAQPAQAEAPQQRRFQLSIELTRQGDVSHGAERGRQRLVQAWRLSGLVATDGVRHLFNPLDPMASQAASEQAAARANAVRPATPAAPPSAQQLQAMQAQAQALMARCGQDAACLQREARAMSAAQVARGDKALEARLLAQRGNDASDDAGPPEPYLHFNGTPACRFEVAMQIDARTEGQFGDVQGLVPFTETARADDRVRGDERCPGLQAVLDTRNGRVWTYLGLLPQEARGSTSREDRGRRREQADTRLGVRWLEAEPLLQRRLQQLDLRGGEDVQRLPVPGGQLELRVRWRFDPA